jgi:hypothetical protein
VITHIILSRIFVAAAVVGLAVPNPAQALTPDEAKAIAMDAYIYGYSLITTEVTRVQMTNVVKLEGLRGPMGQVINVNRYPPADYRGVSAPNADTLYSAAWIDLAKEPWVFSHPDMGTLHADPRADLREWHRRRLQGGQCAASSVRPSPLVSGR